jgi:hypothetical protein
MRPAGIEPAAYGSGGHPGVTLGVRGSDTCSVIASGSADNRVSLRIEALK